MASAREDAKRQLNEHHTEMAMKYLRFSLLQRKEQLKELVMAVSDYKETRLMGDDTFSSEEVGDMLDSLSETLKADLTRNLQRVSHSNVVLLRQLFAQAEDKNANLSVDTSYLEDELLLSLVAKMEEESEKPAAAPVPTPASTGSLKMGTLPSLDGRKEADSLLGANAQLKARMIDLQNELVNVNREKTMLNERVMALEEQSKVAPQEGDTVVAAPVGSVSSAEMEALQTQLATLETSAASKDEELAALQAAMDAKVQETPQFKAMKDMLTKKNQQIKTMREALAGFGWTEPEEQA